MAGTSAVGVGAGVAAVPGVSAWSIWDAPLSGGAADLGGSYGGYSSAYVRSWIGLLVPKD